MEDPGWLRVGEVARRTGLTVRTLHHYDQIGLVVPSGRSSSDYRLYDPNDVRRLLSVQQLKDLGLSLDEIALALADPDFDAAAVLERHIEQLSARVAAEQELLRRLQQMRAASASWTDVLEIIYLDQELQHGDPSVRVRAALRAGRAPLSSLLTQLRSDPDPSVRETLTWAVVQHGAQATSAVLEHIADADPHVRLQMAHVLGKLRDRDGVPALIDLLDDEDPLVATKAAFALGQIGGPDAERALIAQLGRGDETHRDTVTAALAILPLSSVDAVIDHLSDPDPGVRAHAADVLGAVRAASAAPALERLVADPDPEVVLSAVLALGQLGDRGLAALRRATRSDDPRARLVAQRLLTGAE